MTPLLLARLVVSLIAIFLRHRADLNHIATLRAMADRSFRECVIAGPDPRLCFTGNAALVTRREETGGVRGIFERTAEFSVTLHATNQFGEKFLFKWFSKSSKPYIKHVPHGPIGRSYPERTFESANEV